MHTSTGPTSTLGSPFRSRRSTTSKVNVLDILLTLSASIVRIKNPVFSFPDPNCLHPGSRGQKGSDPDPHHCKIRAFMEAGT
jgi:hypothetical protein